MLTAAAYFREDREDEHEIRTLADALYRRADWQWATNDGATVTHGWRPESGFLGYRWRGYDEALLLHILELGSPTYPLPEDGYRSWLSTYTWRKVYDHELLFAGPIFIHQLSHGPDSPAAGCSAKKETPWHPSPRRRSMPPSSATWSSRS